MEPLALTSPAANENENKTEAKNMKASDKVFGTCELLDKILMYLIFRAEKGSRYHQITMARTLRLQLVNKVFCKHINTSRLISTALYLSSAAKMDVRYPWYIPKFEVRCSPYIPTSVPRSEIGRSYSYINELLSIDHRIGKNIQTRRPEEHISLGIPVAALHRKVESWSKMLLFQPPITKLWMINSSQQFDSFRKYTTVQCEAGLTVGHVWEAANDLVKRHGLKMRGSVLFQAFMDEGGDYYMVDEETGLRYIPGSPGGEQILGRLFG